MNYERFSLHLDKFARKKVSEIRTRRRALHEQRLRTLDELDAADAAIFLRAVGFKLGQYVRTQRAKPAQGQRERIYMLDDVRVDRVSRLPFFVGRLVKTDGTLGKSEVRLFGVTLRKAEQIELTQ